MIPAICMALVIGFFSFYLSPWGSQQANSLILEQERRSGLDVLSPRRFHSSSDGRTVTYVEDIDSRAGVHWEFRLHDNPDAPVCRMMRWHLC